MASEERIEKVQFAPINEKALLSLEVSRLPSACSFLTLVFRRRLVRYIVGMILTLESREAYLSATLSITNPGVEPLSQQ